MKFKPSKLYKWEFWPFWFFYIPVYFRYIWYSIKLKAPFFFSAANPSMELGGFAAYSKWDILKEVNEEYLPKMMVLSEPYNRKLIEDFLVEQQLNYPIIVKPDKGERGFGVEKINSEVELTTYLSRAKNRLIVQEYIDYPIELGIMYHRLPNQDRGVISSVVQKDFLSIVGDGVSTLKVLFENGERTRWHLDMLFELCKTELETVLEKDEYKMLVPIGNHVRGATFLNANHIINPKLHEMMDKIAIPIKGYYFGRFDLRVSSIENLYEGKNIKIMELNGANSEPAHIYDPNMKLSAAYKHLFEHWKALYEISKMNHQMGVPYAPFWVSYRKLRHYFKTR